MDVAGAGAGGLVGVGVCEGEGVHYPVGGREGWVGGVAVVDVEGVEAGFGGVGEGEGGCVEGWGWCWACFGGHYFFWERHRGAGIGMLGMAQFLSDAQYFGEGGEWDCCYNSPRFRDLMGR